MEPDITPEEKFDLASITKSASTLSIIIGIFLSLCYFIFYVKALPQFGNFADFVHYVIALALLGLFVLFFTVLLSIAPSLFINSSTTTELRKRYKSIIMSGLLNTFVLIQIFMILDRLHIRQSESFIIIIIFLLLFSSILLYFFRAYKVYKKRHNDPFPVSLLIVVILSIFIEILLLSLGNISMLENVWNQKFSFWPNFILVSSFLFFILIINISIVKKGYLDFFQLPLKFKNDLQKRIAVTSYYALILFLLGSSVAGILNLQNIFITRPFEMLKLGHYYSELSFKDDFIKNDNPFPMNECLEKKNIFFVLSNIGNEYLVKEINEYRMYEITTIVGLDKNISRLKLQTYQDVNGSTFLIYKDKESIYGWDKSQKLKIRSVDHSFNGLSNEENLTDKKDLINTYIYNHGRLYRIHKDNITFEVFIENSDIHDTDWLKKGNCHNLTKSIKLTK